MWLGSICVQGNGHSGPCPLCIQREAWNKNDRIYGWQNAINMCPPFLSTHYENIGFWNFGESSDSGESADSVEFGEYSDFGDSGETGDFG